MTSNVNTISHPIAKAELVCYECWIAFLYMATVSVETGYHQSERISRGISVLRPLDEMTLFSQGINHISLILGLEASRLLEEESYNGVRPTYPLDYI